MRYGRSARRRAFRICSPGPPIPVIITVMAAESDPLGTLRNRCRGQEALHDVRDRGNAFRPVEQASPVKRAAQDLGGIGSRVVKYTRTHTRSIARQSATPDIDDEGLPSLPDERPMRL